MPIPPLPRMSRSTYSPKIRLCGGSELMAAAWNSVSLPLWIRSLATSSTVRGVRDACSAFSSDKASSGEIRRLSRRFLTNCSKTRTMVAFLMIYSNLPAVGPRGNSQPSVSRRTAKSGVCSIFRRQRMESAGDACSKTST